MPKEEFGVLQHLECLVYPLFEAADLSQDGYYLIAFVHVNQWTTTFLFIFLIVPFFCTLSGILMMSEDEYIHEFGKEDLKKRTELKR